MKIVVTGAGGMLGHDVVRAARYVNHDVTALGHAELDVTDADAVRRALADIRPDAIVNCAAYTNVDGAEDDEATATLVNGDGAGNVATAAALVDAYIGPYSAIGDGVTIERAELEYSIVLSGSSVRDLEGRIEASLIGRNVAIRRSPRTGARSSPASGPPRGRRAT